MRNDFFLLYTHDTHASIVVSMKLMYNTSTVHVLGKMSIRKKNFEENEILRLLALYKENAEVLNSKFSNVSTSKLKKQKWEAIQCAVNAIGKQQRTIDELKHKWKDLLSRAKKDYSNRRYPQTGGGPKPPEGPYTHLVLDIIGQSSPVLDGITTCGESTVKGMEEAYEVSEQNIPPAKPSTSCESASDEKDTSVAPKATPLSSKYCKNQYPLEFSAVLHRGQSLCFTLYGSPRHYSFFMQSVKTRFSLRRGAG